MPLMTEYDVHPATVLGRYICNTFDEMIVTIDPNARAAAGLPARGDLRPFDFIIVGGRDVWFSRRGASLVPPAPIAASASWYWTAGPLCCPSTCRIWPVLGSMPGARAGIISRRTKSGGSPGIPVTRSAFPVWPTASADARCFGAAGRRHCWVRKHRHPFWPQAVLDDLRPSRLADGRKRLFPPVE